MLQSSAKLTIDRPERYAKQLASHIGHKAEVTTVDGVHRVKFGFGGTGTISTTSDAVLLSGEAENEDGIRIIKDVLGRHLLKFAKLEDQVLDWS